MPGITENATPVESKKFGKYIFEELPFHFTKGGKNQNALPREGNNVNSE